MIPQLLFNQLHAWTYLTHDAPLFKKPLVHEVTCAPPKFENRCPLTYANKIGPKKQISINRIPRSSG